MYFSKAPPGVWRSALTKQDKITYRLSHCHHVRDRLPCYCDPDDQFAVRNYSRINSTLSTLDFYNEVVCHRLDITVIVPAQSSSFQVWSGGVCGISVFCSSFRAMIQGDLPHLLLSFGALFLRMRL